MRPEGGAEVKLRCQLLQSGTMSADIPKQDIPKQDLPKDHLPKIEDATRDYEQWMGSHISVVKSDLGLKHTSMNESAFAFLRATFYRWMQLWKTRCPELAGAPSVLAVGDLHVENFGKWRDSEGRLIWGINDFDDAYPLAYTQDLVRLTTSARLAAHAGDLVLNPGEASEAIYAGYTDALKAGGQPFVLEAEHNGLREMALGELRDPVRFWEKMQALPAWTGDVPTPARAALEQQLPERGLKYVLKHRVAGLGSLGRQRIAAVAEWRGGTIARETKALLPSACAWAESPASSPRIWCGEIIERAMRVPDPFTHAADGWVVRRLAPDCSRIELASIPKEKDAARLLHAMGWETANVHLGSKQAIGAVEQDLKKRPAGWLHNAARDMEDAITQDWKDWKR